MSEDKIMIKEIDNEQVNYYQKDNNRHGMGKHKEIEEPEVRNWRLAIGILETNGRLNVESVFPIVILDNENEIDIEFLPQIKRVIE